MASFGRSWDGGAVKTSRTPQTNSAGTGGEVGNRNGARPLPGNSARTRLRFSVGSSLISLIHNTEKNGIVHCEVVEGAVDTEIFYNFISNVKLPTNEKYYLIMDNIPFHKNKKIRELLKQKNIEPIYIVPYFPQLNPTEEFFNTVKQDAKK